MRISENSTRFLGQSMLFFFSIESFRELNEISRSENALLLLHWELSRIERDFSVRECSSISILRKSENKTRFLDHRIIFFFSIENISEFSEIARKVNALLFLNWEYQRIQHDFSFRECSSVPPLRISEYSTRFLGQRMLYFFSIENIREFNENTRSENALLFLHWEYPRIQRVYRWQNSRLFSIENIREFHEIFRSENALLFLHWENPRIQRHFLVRKCFTFSPLRISENSTKILGQRMLYYFFIENIRKFYEISRSENALLFFHWEYSRIQRDFSFRECSTVSPLRISENLIRFLGQWMLNFFSIENIREFNEISRSENALLFLH